MATIVIHQRTGERYIVLGAGFGVYQSRKSNWFFGDLMADTEEGQYGMVCVCNKDGKIGWLDSSEVVVESVDGQSVRGALG